MAVCARCGHHPARQGAEKTSSTAVTSAASSVTCRETVRKNSASLPPRLVIADVPRDAAETAQRDQRAGQGENHRGQAQQAELPTCISHAKTSSRARFGARCTTTAGTYTPRLEEMDGPQKENQCI